MNIYIYINVNKFLVGYIPFPGAVKINLEYS